MNQLDCRSFHSGIPVGRQRAPLAQTSAVFDHFLSENDQKVPVFWPKAKEMPVGLKMFIGLNIIIICIILRFYTIHNLFLIKL